MERARQIAAIIVGILLIIVLILVARWTGDRIREKFLTPKAPSLVETTKTSPVYQPVPAAQEQTLSNPSGSSLSAIPSTGPADFGYLVIIFLLLGGTVSKALARR